MTGLIWVISSNKPDSLRNFQKLKLVETPSSRREVSGVDGVTECVGKEVSGHNGLTRVEDLRDVID